MANPYAIEFQQAPILEGLFQGIGQAQAEDKANLANMFQQLRNQQQTLESERYGQMTPMEVQIKGLEAERAKRMGSPEMLDLYAQGYGGQMKSQQAAGELAQTLLPFKQQTGVAEQQNLLQGFKLRNYLADMDRVINAGYDEKTGVELNPQQVQALKQQRDQLALLIASTPEQMGKEELALIKGQQGNAGANRNLLSGIRIKMGTDVPLTEEEAILLGDPELAGKQIGRAHV